MVTLAFNNNNIVNNDAFTFVAGAPAAGVVEAFLNIGILNDTICINDVIYDHTSSILQLRCLFDVTTLTL
jgi:hypothetical protein